MMRADLYADIYAKEDTYWWHVGKRLLVEKLVSRYLHPSTSATPPLRLLDVGCGAGRVLQMLAGQGHVYGTDLSALALEFCRKRGFEEVCQADIIEGLPFPSATFDVITALDVVEHLKDDGAGLQNLWQALKPGGLLIVSVPAYQFMFSYWDEILGHQRRYTLPTLRHRLQEAQFEIEKISYSNSTILIPAATFRLVKSLFLRSKAKPALKNEQVAVTEAETDFFDLPNFLNQFLIKIYQIEAALIARMRLPFGLAVVAVARKPIEVPLHPAKAQAEFATPQPTESEVALANL